MSRKNPIATQLAQITKKVASAKPNKAYPLLYEAFLLFAASGDVPRSRRILEWMYGGRLPTAKQVATANSTQAIDAFCTAAGLGDLTGGQPSFPPSNEAVPLEDRARSAERMTRWSITSDAYQGNRFVGDAWRALAMDDPWRRINQWRDIQDAAAPTPEGDPRVGDEAALPLFVELFSTLREDERGAGYGLEAVLALDVALRHGREDLAGDWAHRFAPRLRDPLRIAQLLCLSKVASRVAQGFLHGAIGLSEAERGAALDGLEAALPTTTPSPKPAKPARIQRRRVGCEYSQLHLEPDELDERERDEVYFQDPRESAQGMSLFRTHVGIGSPNETAYVDVEVSLDPGGAEASLDGVVQAVSFPIEVRAPMVLRSVGGGDDEEVLELPLGRYDVLARFVPKKSPKRDAAAGLRVFGLRLSFRPEGSLDAPRCLRNEDGAPPAETIVAGEVSS